MKARNYRRSRCILTALFLITIPLLRAQTAGSQQAQDPISPLLPQIERYTEQGMQKTGVPGVAVAIVYRDKVVYLKGFGVRKAGECAPVNADHFQLASMSKPISSTVVASVVAWTGAELGRQNRRPRSRLKLSDPAVTEQVTIRDLLSHRSGLPTSAGDMLEDLGFRGPILHQMRLLPLPFPFRKEFHYSNFGYTEGAIAASKALRIQWEDLANQRLFQPLGMTSTSYRWSDYRDALNKAAIHVLSTETLLHVTCATRTPKLLPAAPARRCGISLNGYGYSLPVAHGTGNRLSLLTL